METELRHKILSGEIDINAQQNFFTTAIKGFIFDLNKYISIRGEKVPHFILATGDAEMYVELMGPGNGSEPCDMPSDSFPYTQTPRCVIQPKGISVETDQLSNPYVRGHFNIEHDEKVYGMTAEMRRLPLKMDFELKYYLKSLNDTYDLIQQIMANLIFIKSYYISYLGDTIECSYKVPEQFEPEYSVEFDFSNADTRDKAVSITIELSTNMPIFAPETVVESSALIRTAVSNVNSPSVNTRIIE